ncbi:hypothetical protein HMPREF9733_02298 [Treponema denticola SP33]|uniref:Uncharacterized protein n=1 Tax=Treponema denticola SP33 TaxID=999437 RepID=M2AFL8_TREDN|nr:hypothetical protein HMPREF9733_02298 [Treponema denticola SP33]EPF35918.1 hypothetical protein HMPREF9732_02149 [Treponema denticola SP32]
MYGRVYDKSLAMKKYFVIILIFHFFVKLSSFDLKKTKFLDNGDLVIAYYNLSMEKVYELINKNDFMRF